MNAKAVVAALLEVENLEVRIARLRAVGGVDPVEADEMQKGLAGVRTWLTEIRAVFDPTLPSQEA